MNPTPQIPESFKQKFLDLLEEMETATGKLYEIEIIEFNSRSNYHQKIGAFAQRKNKVVIYEMTEKYTELNGEYENFQGANKKLAELSINDVFEETKIYENTGVLIGKCNKCHEYGVGEKSLNIVDFRECNRCDNISKWKGIRLESRCNSIYSGYNRGRYAELTEIGKWKYA